MVKFTFFFFFFFEKFWLGGAAPQTPRVLAGGAKPPQTPSPESADGSALVAAVGAMGVPTATQSTHTAASGTAVHMEVVS